ncbi:DLEC1 protein, partial [Pomatostomus ruficeps]|nr:DLEC1 protein [Pomatostomus ruficeps]
EFAAALLSQGKGAAFYVQPCTGTLKAFQQLTIEIAAYNNMWGEYQDNLVCQVGDLQPKLIPMQMTVKGCPIFLQLLSPWPFTWTRRNAAPRFGTQVSGGSPVLRRVRLNNPTPFDIRVDWEIYNQEPDDEKLVDLLVLFGDPFPPMDTAGNKAASSGSTSKSEVVLKLDPAAIPQQDPTCTYFKEFRSNFRKASLSQESAREKNISVLIRPHEGVPADSPYSITPRQIVVPGGGSSDVYISFTPLVLPDTEAELSCDALVLGFMSLDDKLARTVPNKVHRTHGHEAPPLRVHVEAVLRHPLLEVETDHDRGMVFYSVASDLLPARPLHGVLTDSVITQSLKLTNCTKVPLYFRLFLSTPSTPFSLSSADPKTSTKTSHSKKEERGRQPQHVLYPQQNMLVKVSFHTTLEVLRYQHLPETQLLPGFQVLQLESGERKLKFDQNVVIEHSNSATQV